jgi:hypothetical protein
MGKNEGRSICCGTLFAHIFKHIIQYIIFMKHQREYINSQDKRDAHQLRVMLMIRVANLHVELRNLLQLGECKGR